MTVKITTLATIAALGLATSAFAESHVANTENDGDPGLDSSFSSMDYKSYSDNYDKSGRFERMDTDKDGVISRDEQMKAEFSRFDANRDGGLDEMESDFLKKEYENETVGGNPDGQ